jgi:hypothetical protein
MRSPTLSATQRTEGPYFEPSHDSLPGNMRSPFAAARRKRPMPASTARSGSRFGAIRLRSPRGGRPSTTVIQLAGLGLRCLNAPIMPSPAFEARRTSMIRRCLPRRSGRLRRAHMRDRTSICDMDAVTEHPFAIWLDVDLTLHSIFRPNIMNFRSVSIDAYILKYATSLLRFSTPAYSFIYRSSIIQRPRSPAIPVTVPFLYH